MKSTGITRKVDELGRIVLPVELRRSLDIEEKTEVEIYTENNTIVLRKSGQSCVFCRGAKGLTAFKGHNICAACKRDIGKV
ncbi:MAG: AbrB/MazE/SpoVT family DNA-binding domain-containing protein [Oscillospiraceae bacterium]|nr:AbrB/MazE/SpoVT family DNA-binding domain-containing protein [Oscillospiraceae bacterium]